jgi:hypothetical protein
LQVALTPVELASPYEITKPGAYLIPDRAYREDPCEAPSFTQSIAKILLEKSPGHAWVAHPRLNPDWEPDDATKYDIGNIAHKMLIGRGREIVVLAFDDWRKKEAQDLRKHHTARGELAVLEKDVMLGIEMEKSARDYLKAEGYPEAFKEGWGEVVLAWQEGDLWMRVMMDWLTPGALPFYDYKTTKQSAAPHMLGWKAVNDGWDVQAAMVERGLAILDPENAGRRKARFVVHESEPPFAMSVMQMRESWMVMGRKKLSRAFFMWRKAMETEEWPTYEGGMVEPDYPGSAETQFLAREEEMVRVGAWGDGLKDYGPAKAKMSAEPKKDLRGAG